MLINTRPLGTERKRGERVTQSRGGLSVPATACGAQLASSITQINFENHSGTLHLIATKTLGNPPSPSVSLLLLLLLFVIVVVAIAIMPLTEAVAAAATPSLSQSNPPRAAIKVQTFISRLGWNYFFYCCSCFSLCITPPSVPLPT